MSKWCSEQNLNYYSAKDTWQDFTNSQNNKKILRVFTRVIYYFVAHVQEINLLGAFFAPFLLCEQYTVCPCVRLLGGE